MNHLQTSNTRNRSLSAAILIAVFLVYGLMTLLTPPYFDDMYFKAIYNGFTWTSEAIPFSMEKYADYLRMFYETDNIRLANWLDIFLLLDPTIYKLSAILIGLCSTFIFWSTARMASGSWWNPRALSIMTLLLAVALPWRDSMFLRVYATNYIITASIMLCCVFLLMDSLKTPRSSKHLFKNILSAVLCVITAWVHELFGVALLGGMGLIIVFRLFRKQSVPVFWWITIPAIVAIIAYTTCFTPGMVMRLGKESALSSIFAAPTRVVLHNIAGFIFIGAVIFGLATKRFREQTMALTENPLFLFLIGSILSSIIISATAAVRPRTGFIAQLFGPTGLLYILFQSRLSEKKAISGIAGVSMLAFLSIGISAIHWEYKFFRMDSLLYKKLKESPNGTVFYDIISREDVPWYTMAYPMRHVWAMSFHYYSIMYCNIGENLSVVPTSLSTDLDNAGFKTLNKDLDIRMLDKAIYTDCKKMPDIKNIIDRSIAHAIDIHCKIVYADGSIDYNNDCSILRFIGTNGKQYYHIRPYWRVPPRSEITGISISE